MQLAISRLRDGYAFKKSVKFCTSCNKFTSLCWLIVINIHNSCMIHSSNSCSVDRRDSNKCLCGILVGCITIALFFTGATCCDSASKFQGITELLQAKRTKFIKVVRCWFQRMIDSFDAKLIKFVKLVQCSKAYRSNSVSECYNLRYFSK